MLPYPLHLCDQNDHNHHIFSPLISLVITKIMIAMTNIMIAITKIMIAITRIMIAITRIMIAISKIMIAITRMGSFRSSTRWVFYHRATNPQELSCSLQQFVRFSFLPVFHSYLHSHFLSILLLILFLFIFTLLLSLSLNISISVSLLPSHPLSHFAVKCQDPLLEGFKKWNVLSRFSDSFILKVEGLVLFF